MNDELRYLKCKEHTDADLFCVVCGYWNQARADEQVRKTQEFFKEKK